MATRIGGTTGVDFPDGVNFDIDQSLTANGYQDFPGGLIIQWGVTTTSDTSVTFYKAFPNACFNVQISWNASVGNAYSYWLNANNVTQYGFDLGGLVASSSRFWVAFGW